VTKLWADDWDSIPGRSSDFSFHHCIQIISGAHPASYPMGTSEHLPRGKVVGGMKLDTHLHLVLRLRMHGTIPPLPQYVLV